MAWRERVYGLRRLRRKYGCRYRDGVPGSQLGAVRSRWPLEGFVMKSEPKIRMPVPGESGTVLVVVDLQNGFVNRPTRHVVPVVKTLAQQWISAGGQVVFTRYHNYPGSPYERLLRWYKLRAEPETTLVAELDELLPQATTVIDKTGYTVFTAEMDKLIAEHGWTDVVLCGVDTETCVLKSAADAFERGLTPWLISDACASNGGKRMHESGLRLAGRFIGPPHVIGSTDLPV